MGGVCPMLTCCRGEAFSGASTGPLGPLPAFTLCPGNEAPSPTGQPPPPCMVPLRPQHSAVFHPGSRSLPELS